ncbi:hypothetical protein RCJ22_26820 [Vibrio sp. FNV 38]|nr:hypothetical protein [Vibrio sp. FNV 38]
MITYPNNIDISESMYVTIDNEAKRIEKKYRVSNEMKVHVSLDRTTKLITVEALVDGNFCKSSDTIFQCACNRCFSGLEHQLDRRKTQEMSRRRSPAVKAVESQMMQEVDELAGVIEDQVELEYYQLH